MGSVLSSGCITNAAFVSDQAVSGSGNRVVYGGYEKSRNSTLKTLPSVLHQLKRLSAANMIPKVVTDSPKILSIACGFAEDVPFYRAELGEGCCITGIDVTPRYQVCAQQEKNNDTNFLTMDARHLDFEPVFDLLTMRHPEPCSNKEIWTEIFVEASIFAQRCGAPIMMTTFCKHERDFFIRIADMMLGERGVKLLESYINESIAPNYDEDGVPFGRDRYVAVFVPKN